MSSCLRLTLCFNNRTLISNKSYSPKYFSALSLNRINCNKNLSKKFIKINSNSVPNRSLSLESFPDFYNSIRSSDAARIVKETLIESHDITGFSWTAIIIAASVAMKLFIALPSGIYQKYMVSKLELIEVELVGMRNSIVEKVQKRAIKEKWTAKRMNAEFKNEVLKHRKHLIIKNNCHPFKTVIIFFLQLPVWLLLTVAIRTFAVESSTGQSDHPVAALQFQVGGPFWSRNLSMPDPTYILPTINFLALLATTELSFLSKTPEKISSNKARVIVKKVFPNFLRAFAVMFFFISAISPSGLSLFWASNTVLALGQSLLIMSPRMRRLCRIPKAPSDYDRPFSQAWERFLEKFTKIFNRTK